MKLREYLSRIFGEVDVGEYKEWDEDAFDETVKEALREREEEEDHRTLF